MAAGQRLLYEFPSDAAGLDLGPPRETRILLPGHRSGIEVDEAVIRSALCVRAQHVR